MPFIPRTQQTIRTALLNDLSSRYAQLSPPQQVATWQGTDDYMFMDALAVQNSLLEYQALANTANIFPDTADAANLAHHGAVEGVSQRTAGAFVGTIVVTGTPSATLTFGTAVLTFNGVNYGSFANATTGAAITSVVLDSSGNGLVRVTSGTTGTATSLAAGTVLTWSSPPTGANSTAVATGTTTIALDSDGDILPQSTINVASTIGFALSGPLLVTSSTGVQTIQYTGVTASSFTGCTGGTGTLHATPPTVVGFGTVSLGTAAETAASWAQRIIARMQERPASGNRADWIDWVGQCDGVQDAFVYPLMQCTVTSPMPMFITGIPGLVTIIPAGPPTGDTPDPTGAGRTLTQAACDNIADFLEGNKDQHGNSASVTGVQLRPVTLFNTRYTNRNASPNAGNYVVFPGLTTVLTVQVTVSVSATGAYNPAFAGVTYQIASWDPTTLTLTMTGDPVGVSDGQIIQVSATAATKRGSVDFATVAHVIHGSHTIQLASWPANEIPLVGGIVSAGCPSLKSIQLATFDYFDSLGPGDIAAGMKIQSARVPTQDILGRAVYSNSTLEARILDAFPGALSVDVTLPGFDVTLQPMTFAVLGVLTITLFPVS